MVGQLHIQWMDTGCLKHGIQLCCALLNNAPPTDGPSAPPLPHNWELPEIAAGALQLDAHVASSQFGETWKGCLTDDHSHNKRVSAEQARLYDGPAAY